MSAPLLATSGDMGRLSRALDQFSQTTRTTGVRLDCYGCITVRVSGTAEFSVRWDDEENAYLVDDRVGS